MKQEQVARYRIRKDGYIQQYWVSPERAGPPLPEGLSFSGNTALYVENQELVAYFDYTGPIVNGIRLEQWVSRKKGAGRRLLNALATRDDAPTTIHGDWTPSGYKAAKDVLLPLGYQLEEFGKRSSNMTRSAFYLDELPAFWGGKKKTTR